MQTLKLYNEAEQLYNKQLSIQVCPQQSDRLFKGVTSPDSLQHFL